MNVAVLLASPGTSETTHRRQVQRRSVVSRFQSLPPRAVQLKPPLVSRSALAAFRQSLTPLPALLKDPGVPTRPVHDTWCHCFAGNADQADDKVKSKKDTPETSESPHHLSLRQSPSPPAQRSWDATRQFLALVSASLLLGIVFSVITLFLMTNIGIKFSVIKVLRKFIKSDVARQVMTITGSMLFVRSGLTPLVRAVRDFLGIRTPWETSIECYLLRELYSPLELLLVVAALAALAESLLPSLISVPRSIIATVVRSMVSVMFVTAAGKVVNNMKGRIFREAKWRMELEGKTTEQHRIDAIDKLLTVGIFIVASITGLQALGLDVNSVLAIGGVGGLAIGLAGREIFENLFSGLLIMGSRAFEVGDEVMLLSMEQKVVGIVVDVGWYRTIVRDFEREVYIIPNSLFSRTVVLNVSRKGREWRFFEHVPIRLRDLEKADAIVSDMRRVIRQDSRVIQKLHKRAFLDKITREYIEIYISFYIEAPNRDAFMAARQQFFLDFADCVVRNGGEIAEKKLIVEYNTQNPNGMMEQPTFLTEETLETMDMVDADAETIINASTESSERGPNGFPDDMSHSPLSSSTMFKNIASVDDSPPFSPRSGKRNTRTPPG